MKHTLVFSVVAALAICAAFSVATLVAEFLNFFILKIFFNLTNCFVQHRSVNYLLFNLPLPVKRLVV
jgi:hypothetical protein